MRSIRNRSAGGRAVSCVQVLCVNRPGGLLRQTRDQIGKSGVPWPVAGLLPTEQDGFSVLDLLRCTINEYNIVRVEWRIVAQRNGVVRSGQFLYINACFAKRYF